MNKRLTRIGNSYGLVIEKPILELLGISAESDLDMTTDGTRLFIEPIASAATSGAGSVEAAIRKCDLTDLRTPEKGQPFLARIKPNGVALELGQNRYVTVLRWDWLEGVVPFLRLNPLARVSGAKSVTGKAGTLDGYCKTHTKVLVSNYVAALLDRARVVDVFKNPLRVQLTSDYRS
jgi:hypothetical protein